MCGINIVVGNPTAKGFVTDADIQPFLRQASIAGTVRGADSTGIFQLALDRGKRSLFSHKRAVDGATFEQLRKADAYFKDAPNAMATVLHHRAATNGKVNDINAHPFVVPTSEDNKCLIGVHNGSLKNFDRVKYDVDSEWALSQLGKSDNYLETLSSFDGPYVFVFYDERQPGNIFIARGKERTFAFGIQAADNKNYLLGASEADMLYWLTRRNRLVFNENKVIECAENTLYTIPLDDVRSYSTEAIPVKTPMVIVPPVYNNHYNRSRKEAWGAYEGDRGYASSYKTEAQKVAEALGVPNRVIPRDAKASPMQAPAGSALNSQSTSTNQTSNTTTVSTETVVGTKARMELEDQQYANHLSLAGEEVVFEYHLYDDEAKTVYGNAMVSYGRYSDEMRAVMFDVDEDLAEAMKLSDWMEAKIIGAYDDPDDDKGIIAILGKPTTIAASGTMNSAKVAKLASSTAAGIIESSGVQVPGPITVQ